MLRKLIAMLSLPLLLAVAACGDDGGAAEDSDAPRVVKIGSVFSQTGPGATTGLDGSRAIQLAVDDINKAGGFEVDGIRYVLEHETKDIQSDPNLSAQATQDLIEGFGATVIFGAENSAATTPITTTVQRSGDVILLSAATNLDGFVGKGDPLFRQGVPEQLFMEGYIPVVAEMLPGVKRVALMFQNDPVGSDLAKRYGVALAESGIDVVHQELFAAGETNFVPLLQRISGDIDALVVGWYDDSAASGIMDAADEVGLPSTFIARGPSALPGLERQGEIDAYTFVVSGDDPAAPSTPESEELLKRYAETYKLDPSQVTFFLYLNYDYVGMVVKAMQQAGTVDDIDAIADAIRGIEYTDGVLPITFDEDGINTSPARAGLITADEIVLREFQIG